MVQFTSYFSSYKMALSFMTPFWEHVMQRVQTKIFTFSCHFPCSIRSVSQQTFTCKNSSLRQRKQGCKTNITGELRAILRLCWTALKTNRCKKMRIYNTTLKLARFIHIMLRKNVLTFQQFPEYFGIFAVACSYRALQKNSTSISREKFTGYSCEFKGK